MKTSIINLGIVALLLLGLAISSCDKKAATQSSTSDKTEKLGKEYTSAYICPMHCEGSGSDQPGTCPVCGMDYVMNEDHKGHDHMHDDHNHNEDMEGNHSEDHHHEHGDHHNHNH